MTHYFFLPTTTMAEKHRILSEFNRNFSSGTNLLASASPVGKKIDSPDFSSVLLKKNCYPWFHEIERLSSIFVLFLMQLDLLRNTHDLDDQTIFKLVSDMETQCIDAVIELPCLFTKSALMCSLCHQAELAWAMGMKYFHHHESCHAVCFPLAGVGSRDATAVLPTNDPSIRQLHPSSISWDGKLGLSQQITSVDQSSG